MAGASGVHRVVGPYRLVRVVGEGGMGVVHLALTPDGRQVAVKVLRPHVVGDTEARERLAREVAALQRVRSRHVAEVLDADPWGEVPYLVTRYVEGRSLGSLVRERGPVPAAGALRLGSGLLTALGDVHAAGVLHRDVKPTNVLLEGHAPVLVDFGLARLAEDPQLTATGFLLGTPGYLAPEVLVGERPTTATDVHGWAATLVFALTGRPPYGTGHQVAVLDRTRRGEADLAGVPDALRPLLAACLAVDPRDRPVLATLRARVAATHGLDPGHPTGAGPAPGPVTRVLSSAPTLVGPAVPPTRVAPQLPPDPSRIAPLPAGWPPPPAPTAVRPVPVQPAPAGRLDGGGAPRRLTGAQRACRAALLLALGAAVAAGVAAAPYVALLLLAAGVVVVRGVSRAQDAHRDRRWRRGVRWYDGPLAAAGWPWHVLAGSVGAAVLVVGAATAGALAAAVALVGGAHAPAALLLAGSTVALAGWWGPGARRVRRTVGGAATAAAQVLPVAALLLAALAGLVALEVAALGNGVDWSPATGPPWAGLRDLVAPWR